MNNRDFYPGGSGTVPVADMHPDFGNGIGLSLVASFTANLGFLGVVADGTEGNHKTPFAFMVHQGGNFMP
jgi:hypothetical protein